MADHITVKPLRSEPVRTGALVALGTAGVISVLAMPVVAAALVGKLGYSEQQVGLFSMVQLAAISAGCLVSVFLPRGCTRRIGIVALGIALVCDLLSLFAHGGPAFIIVRALSGCAGGVMVSQATAALGRTSSPERGFGYFQALQTAVAVTCIYAVPVLVKTWGFGAAYGLLGALNLAALATIVLLLDEPGVEGEKTRIGGNNADAWLRSAGLLLSILCLFIGVGALWTFLALLGQGIGLLAAQVALVLTLSKLVAFGATFLPGVIGLRFGRIAPLVVCAGLLVLSVQLFVHGASFVTFLAATALFSFGWYVLYPFQLGALAHVDRDGRPMLAASALTGAGMGIGPALAVAGPGGATSVYFVASFAFAAAGVFGAAALMTSFGRLRLAEGSSS